MKRHPTLAILLATALPLATTPGTASARPEPAAIQIGEHGRTRVNLNADWRFVFANPAGAEQPGFDDAQWERVGLPHSFSIPYFQASGFPEGDGWYRRHLQIDRLASGRRLSLEFEGAFQTARIFVNGRQVGGHRGGYTGFVLDITDAVRVGDNVVAVHVDNTWDARLAPRAGEHVFSGGLYRDVWLSVTDAVHVPWTGTSVTTPGLNERTGRVAIRTEVRNDGAAPAGVTARTTILDDRGQRVATLADRRTSIAPGTTAEIAQESAAIARPRLWSPETPTLYRAVTTLVVDGIERDRFETTFGFRWFEWTADSGFFLNGKRRYLRGANVHQDQAGWGDAVTNAAMARDVAMMKDAGFDFIRGSHYPHDPAFTDATDRLGMIFLSEAPFWGIGGFQEGGKWLSPAYPTDVADRPAFEDSVRQQLTEMIRIHRNHPSIMGWSMGNEVFFSAPVSMPQVRRFLSDLVALTHRLDATRPAVIGGAQRGEVDRIGDVAGYNGDGATLFLAPGVASMVTEYGSTMTDRPGEYAPGWGELEKSASPTKGDPYPWRYPWRSGEAIWAGFDHGSIVGHTFGSMGIVDYARLPKRSWYWYRNAYRGVAPPAWPVTGTPAALKLTTSAPAIERADGTDDVQVIVTVVDAQGRALSANPPVRLAIESGPGELPTGRAIAFRADGDIPIRDGQAAIALRSWQSGTTRLRASSPGLRDAVLDIVTRSGPAFVAGTTPLAPDRPYRAVAAPVPALSGEGVFGTDNPVAASSSASGASPRQANDGDPATAWRPASTDRAPSLTITPEKILRFARIELTFDREGRFGFVAEVQQDGGRWATLAEQRPGEAKGRVRIVTTTPLVGSLVRIRLLSGAGEMPGIAELRLFGTQDTR